MDFKLKRILEAKNVLKETLKGSYFEGFTKQLYTLLNKNKKEKYIINAEDNHLTVKILHRILTEKSNCIDIGCNTGEFLASILELSPSGSHYAFEPIPRLADRLRKRFPKTNVIEAALSDSEGEATFWYVVNSPALSSLKKGVWSHHIPNALTESILVKVHKLDNVLPADLKIDFIKIDVEGVEYSVLKGGREIIKNHRPYIIFEHGKDDNGVRHDSKIYDFLVDDCCLKIYELKSWVEGFPPLTKDEFVSSPFWNFLAVPE
ncbi:methyltransferase, FkbM family [Rivularia sp. PCC 7116]|nr:methyltransferase, FkbM family [Rivularia sp. PCC 7116]